MSIEIKVEVSRYLEGRPERLSTFQKRVAARPLIGDLIREQQGDWDSRIFRVTNVIHAESRDSVFLILEVEEI